MAAFFDFVMVSRRPGRYLKTFLDPMASLSFNMGPWRATATPFTPQIIDFPHFVGAPISSERPFHLRSISPSTASPNYGTHLDFAATPYNIDIFLKDIYLLHHRQVSRPQIPKPAQKPEMRVAPFLNVFLKTTYFLKMSISTGILIFY